MTGRRFRWALAAIALVALGSRVAYGLHVGGAGLGIGDDDWYHLVANGLVHGRGFSDPFTSPPKATAFHLPAFPWLLAAFSKLGLTSYTAHQAVGWGLGALTAVLVALVARRLWDWRAGLLAGAVAAVWPALVANDSVGMSESLYGALIAATLLLALRLRERPGWGRAAALGAALAAATLTREETLLLVVLLLPWIARRARPRDAAVVAGVVVLLCAPWAIRNSVLFDRPVLLTTGDGSVFAGANVPSTYHGAAIGSADFKALFAGPVGRHPSANEAVQSARWRKEGLSYASHHAGRVPAVVGARVLRTWGFYPFDPRTRATQVAFLEARSRGAELVAWPALIAVLALGLAGALALRRRGGGALWLLAAPCILITVVSATGYGAPRFAQAGLVAFAVLAGGGAVRALSALAGAAGRRGAPAP